MNAIEVNDLTKSFDGKTNALNGIGLVIPEGSVFGFLGPNGAGKTTAIRLINGILKPDKGGIYFFQKPLEDYRETIHSLCGVMTESAGLYEGMTGQENLEFFSQLFGNSAADAKKRSADLLEQFGLIDDRVKKVKAYSSGMKKRLSLARALLHKPKVLFLDEPTSGLDPEAAKSVNDFIVKTAKEEKVTVFLCTHQLRYAEDICDIYGFIHKGRLLGFGTLKELMRKTKESVRIVIRGSGIPYVELGLDKTGDSFHRSIQDDADAAVIIESIIRKGGKIFDARQEHMGLEDLYFAYQKEAFEGEKYV